MGQHAGEIQFHAFKSDLNSDGTIEAIQSRLSFLVGTNATVRPGRVHQILAEEGFQVPLSELLVQAYSDDDESRRAALAALLHVQDQQGLLEKFKGLEFGDNGQLSAQQLAAFTALISPILNDQAKEYDREMQRPATQQGRFAIATGSDTPSHRYSRDQLSEIVKRRKSMGTKLGTFNKDSPGASLMELLCYHQTGADELEIQQMVKVPVHRELVTSFFASTAGGNLTNFKSGCLQQLQDREKAPFGDVIAGGYVASESTINILKAKQIAQGVTCVSSDVSVILSSLDEYMAAVKQWRLTAEVYKLASQLAVGTNRNLSVQDTTDTWTVVHARDNIIPSSAWMAMGPRYKPLESNPREWIQTVYNHFLDIPNNASSSESPTKKARVVATTETMRASGQCFQFNSGACKWGDNCRYLHEDLQFSADNHRSYRGGDRGGKGGKSTGKGRARSGFGHKGGKGGKSTPRRDRECWDFAGGDCRRGTECRFLHDGVRADHAAWGANVLRTPEVGAPMRQVQPLPSAPAPLLGNEQIAPYQGQAPPLYLHPSRSEVMGRTAHFQRLPASSPCPTSARPQGQNGR